MNHQELSGRVDSLLGQVGLNQKSGGGKLSFTGLDPVLPTVLKSGAASACVLAANAIASAAIWQARGGEGQDVHVDLRLAPHVQSPFMAPNLQYTRIHDVPVGLNQNFWGSTTGNVTLRCKDGGWVHHCAVYPSQVLKSNRLLNTGCHPDQLAAAALQWNAQDLEDAAAEIRLPISRVRTVEEWKASEQYQAIRDLPLILLEKIGDSPPIPLPPAARPLSGLRALGMVHVVAGPTVLRQLGAQGADSLNLCLPDYAERPDIWLNSDTGMRSAFLNCKTPEGRQRVYDLVSQADVFVHNLAPGTVEKEGFSAEELASRRPGLIYASVSCYGTAGPWKDRVGFDLNGAAVAGLLTCEGTPEQPRFPMLNVVNDFLTGYLVAIGVQAALLRRAREGGSYRVRVGLTPTTTFLLDFGLIAREQWANLDPARALQTPRLVTAETPMGRFTRMASQVDLSKTPEYWEDPIIAPMGASAAEWRAL